MNTIPASDSLAIPAQTQVTGVLRIPVANAQVVEFRYALLTSRDCFDPLNWTTIPMQRADDDPRLFELDLDTLGLSDGAYEYEFVIDGRNQQPVADPYAKEITRFGGYRGIFHIKNGHRFSQPFSWQDEFTENASLPNNNEIVIYEMPLRWMSSPAGETGSLRQIGLGTFDKVIFERLDELKELGINTIELLPVQDSADTLNWGYGTRFFFAPDYDMGAPIDLKIFIKRCHQRGIRVFLDVVMNHARECPLEALAEDWFFLRDKSEEPGRGEDYGARLFRYRKPGPDGRYRAKEFHYQAAEYWIREYHVDGFRLDEFRGIDHWEFIQTYTEKARAINNQFFPNRPFLVIAEDSWRRTAIVKNQSNNPNGRKIVDSMWNFAFRDELRRLIHNKLDTQWGEPSRRQRIQAMITGWQTWEDMGRKFKHGFNDISQSINYTTSHDVEAENEQRLFNFILSLSDGNDEAVRYFVDNLSTQTREIQTAHQDALDRFSSAFGLLVTSVGIPMLLAGEEFADCHDLDHRDWRLKMSDPVDWRRKQQTGRSELWKRIQDLIHLRSSHGALQQNDIDFFYFHPGIDENGGARVFAYCRTNSLSLGSNGQVIVVANAGPENYPLFEIDWPWEDTNKLQEHAKSEAGALTNVRTQNGQASMSLAPYQVRVFST